MVSQHGRPRPDVSSEGKGDLYGLSLDILHDLLIQWRDLWITVADTAAQLPPDVRASLRELPDDPKEGLYRAHRAFATAVHPDVVAFLVSHLDAAAATVDQLLEEGRRGSTHYDAPSRDLEERVRHLESVLGGVGAVLRTLGQLSLDQPRRD